MKGPEVDRTADHATSTVELAALEPGPVVPLTGDEEFAPGISVRDFWSWGFSDLRLNTLRGMLAQFLVARALGDERAVDEGWGNYDVLTPEGIRVEAKSSAFLQSWRQLRLSTISFHGRTGRSWSDTEGQSAERQIRADVFVFAVQTCRDPASYDMLDLSAWEFRTLPAATVKQLGVRSMTWSTLIAHAPDPVAWPDLREAVVRAALIEQGESGISARTSGSIDRC